ncbi:MAG: tRNA-dihydrouridine synthase family protein [Bacteroidales bacterium]|nr:tRNA-dihydrouridine synthase family protein [Bacteroidales bacterium]
MSIPSPIYFAPFQSITTPTFRRVYAKHFGGVDKLYTPYFSGIAVGTKLPAKKLDALKNQFENGIEVIPQILSKDAQEIIWFAKHCEDLGFKELNWNLGCPYPQVANKQRGSGLLLYPDKINEILDIVFQKINLPFSVKCRLGYQTKEELTTLIPVFNNYPIHEITIHARTGKQLYGGQTDWDSFSEISKQLLHPIAYNGDVFTPKDFAAIQAQMPNINRWMLGRGILYNPFLPSQIKGYQLPENPTEKLRMFLDDLYFEYRKDKNDNLAILNTLKEYWSYLIHIFDDPNKVFRKLKKCKTFNDYEDAVHAVFHAHDIVFK